MTSALTAHAPAERTAGIPKVNAHNDVAAPTTPRPYLAAVPDCEPPFDDQRSAVSRLQRLRAATQARLAAGTPGGGTALLNTSGSTIGGGTRTPDVAVPDTVAQDGVPGWSQDADMGVRRTATAQLPAAGKSGSMLARALVEVLCGQRPVPQLRVHCAPEVFAGLQVRSTTGGALGHLLTVRVSEPAEGVAEVAAVFRRGDRVRALAFRMQGVDGRWRVTALQTA
jgi:hypothetical protein